MELCPVCSKSVMIDLLWERGNENKNIVGQCPYCKKAFTIVVTKEEEQIGFKYSILTPITTKKFNDLVNSGCPKAFVSADDDSMATEVRG